MCKIETLHAADVASTLVVVAVSQTTLTGVDVARQSIVAERERERAGRLKLPVSSVALCMCKTGKPHDVDIAPTHTHGLALAVIVLTVFYIVSMLYRS